MLAAELLWPPPVRVLIRHLPESCPGDATARGRHSTPLKLLAYAGLGFWLPAVLILGSH